ncbi:MaoC family dehydratase N-terminal domain-containing protein [Paraconexibacter sp.]|uniref:FAS1-like dehydratase domain-containing protein n=1 Tax=Paraconexibacter sp. TaxID=2949640 RepID=UPI00356775FF
MTVSTAAIGKRFPAVTYAVGREKVREYARAIGETGGLHLDLDEARAAGHADLVAPPMFAAVYCAPAMGPALFDPDVGMDFARMVHASQEFRWGPLVVAGDEIRTEVLVQDIRERDGRAFYVFTSTSTNQRGDIVCVGSWTNIVRGR